ncbi:DUF1364 domain-containing protein [Dyella kyungheensis]|uniref:DUF1364 domain-containing protein n=1 Tax=Dyella kyungheensis TaxID=1242174 RepID=UPI003CF8CB98
MKRTELRRHTPLRQKARSKPVAAPAPVLVQPYTERKPIRATRPKMTPLRKFAKGQPCMVRLPGCDGGGETTVLAHYRLAGYCGIGVKPEDDAFGAWACASCHNLCDGRAKLKDWTYEEIRLAHAEGVMRTRVAISREAA